MTDEQMRHLERDLGEIKVALVGLDRRSGLIGKIEDVCHRVEANAKRISDLERMVNRMWGYMVGAGLISAGTAVGANWVIRTIAG